MRRSPMVIRAWVLFTCFHPIAHTQTAATHVIVCVGHRKSLIWPLAEALAPRVGQNPAGYNAAMTNVTQILSQAEQGDSAAAEHLLPLVYNPATAHSRNQIENMNLAGSRLVGAQSEQKGERTMSRTALVTGASSGIGESATLLLKQSGYTVYGAARRVERMKTLEAEGVHVLSLDVTDEESIAACVNTIAEGHGSIDILVNNAGYGSYGAVEDVSIDEARRQFEVNLFGLARLTQLVLPDMREKKFGRIINVTSVGGKIYTPFGAWYHATKHALEGWSDALRLETQPFGVDVVIIEPGGIKTEWGDIAVENLRKTSGSGPYCEAANRTADAMSKMYEGDRLSDPVVIGKLIHAAATARRPKTRYAAGYMARRGLFLRWMLTDRMFDRLINSMA